MSVFVQHMNDYCLIH